MSTPAYRYDGSEERHPGHAGRHRDGHPGVSGPRRVGGETNEMRRVEHDAGSVSAAGDHSDGERVVPVCASGSCGDDSADAAKTVCCGSRVSVSVTMAISVSGATSTSAKSIPLANVYKPGVINKSIPQVVVPDPG